MRVLLNRLALSLVVMTGVTFGEPADAEAGVLRKVRGRTQSRGSVKGRSNRGSGSSRERSGGRRGRARNPRVYNGVIAGYGAGLFLYGPYGYRPYYRDYGVQREVPERVEEQPPEPFNLQLGLSSGRGEADEGEVNRYRVSLRLQTPWSVDLSTGGLMLVEPIRDRPDDRLALWKATAWLRIVEREAVEASIGLGFRRLFDPADGENGGHIAGTLRLFPIEPFVLEGRLDAGRIGAASHLDWRASAGVVFGPAELQVAWTGLTFDDIRLTGPSLGVRFWL